MTPASDVQFVIIHHRSPDTVSDVVRGALSCGVNPAHVVVVDNSPASDPALDMPDGVHVVRVENRGYAAAANYGVQMLRELPDTRPLTIVGSHEVEISPATLTLLVAAMSEDERIAAAGPTFLLEGSDNVWSTGGYFSRFLHRADHLRKRAAKGTPPQDREWLDGALVLYRTDLLELFLFDESYFLYFEETDLHVRLSRAGHRVVWVPDAVSHQRSSEIPPRLLGRNTLLFQARHFNRWTGRAAVLVAMVRAAGRKAVTGRGEWNDTRQILAGSGESAYVASLALALLVRVAPWMLLALAGCAAAYLWKLRGRVASWREVFGSDAGRVLALVSVILAAGALAKMARYPAGLRLRQRYVADANTATQGERHGKA